MNEASKFGQDVKEFKKRGEVGLNHLGDSISDITERVADTTAELSEKTMDTIKKYPLHTALAAGAVGFLAGAFVARK